MHDTPGKPPPVKTPISFADARAEGKVQTGKAMSKLYTVSFVSVFFIIAQLIGGYMSGSIAIFADSAHLASDLLGFGIAIAGVKMAERESDKEYSYGWHRAELVGTVMSIASMWVMTIWLLSEATKRFFMPPMVQGQLMFIVAVMGLIFNLIQIKILHGGDTHFHLGESIHGHSHDDEGGDHGHAHDHGHSHGAKAIDNAELSEPLTGEVKEHGHAHGSQTKPGGMNIDGATLHVLGDMLMSVGVIIASIIIYIWPNLWYCDPLCTYLFSIIVCVTTLPIVKKCLNIMMEGTPQDVKLDDLEETILDADKANICEIHDLHVWTIGGGKLSMSVHIRTANPLKTLALVTNAIRVKHELYHTTIQVEGVQSKDENKYAFMCDNDVHDLKEHTRYGKGKGEPDQGHKHSH